MGVKRGWPLHVSTQPSIRWRYRRRTTVSTVLCRSKMTVVKVYPVELEHLSLSVERRKGGVAAP